MRFSPAHRELESRLDDLPFPRKLVDARSCIPTSRPRRDSPAAYMGFTSGIRHSEFEGLGVPQIPSPCQNPVSTKVCPGGWT